MSHFTTVSAELKDLEAVKSAVARLGFELRENVECRYYYGTQRKGLVISLPGEYDASLEKQTDGSYRLVADWYGGQVAESLGESGAILLQAYAVEKARIEGRKRGFSVSERQEGEDVLVTLRDPAGGALKVWCAPGGSITCQPDGIRGESCMKFYDLEKALGAVDEHQKTGDFYLKDSSGHVLVNVVNGRHLCG